MENYQTIGRSINIILKLIYMLKLFKFMLAVFVLVILSHYYNLHKKKKGSRELDKLDLIQEYLFNNRCKN